MKTLTIGIADYGRMKARTLAIARGERTRAPDEDQCPGGSPVQAAAVSSPASASQGIRHVIHREPLSPWRLESGERERVAIFPYRRYGNPYEPSATSSCG